MLENFILGHQLDFVLGADFSVPTTQLLVVFLLPAPPVLIRNLESTGETNALLPLVNDVLFVLMLLFDGCALWSVL